LAGCGVFLYSLIHGISHVTDSLTQVVVPGRAELSLKGGQAYTVFLEEQSVVRGKVYSTAGSVDGLACLVTSIPKGEAIALGPPGMSQSYAYGGRSGRSVLGFSIQKDGNYEFACDYGENPPGPEVVLAVGSGVGKAIFLTVGECLAAVFTGGCACLIVVLAVVRRRDREMKRVRQLGQVPIC
jgi:hypothetical protein